jgi:HPt (histidine-containing phosphotransfer) domain-containing protein
MAASAPKTGLWMAPSPPNAGLKMVAWAANASLKSADIGLEDLEIEGLDPRQGLVLTGGTLERYVAVLELYRRDAEKRIDILSNYPIDSNLTYFITQVHALKSASASVGAPELSRLAMELEKAGDQGDLEFIQANLGAFLEKLAATAEGIKAALSKKAASSPGQEPGGPGQEPLGLGAALNQLKDALASENVGDADRIVASLCDEPLGDSARDSLSRISDLVLVGEFKKALAIAENIAQ